MKKSFPFFINSRTAAPLTAVPSYLILFPVSIARRDAMATDDPSVVGHEAMATGEPSAIDRGEDWIESERIPCG
jgi:hypothetical protein